MRLRREDHRQEPDADEAIFLSDRVVVRASRPGRIKTDLVVDLERPRSGEVDTTPRFGEIERRVLADIREETLEMMAPSGLSRHRADCEVPLPESPERTAAAFVTHAMDAGSRHPPLPLAGEKPGVGVDEDVLDADAAGITVATARTRLALHHDPHPPPSGAPSPQGGRTDVADGAAGRRADSDAWIEQAGEEGARGVCPRARSGRVRFTMARGARWRLRRSGRRAPRD